MALTRLAVRFTEATSGTEFEMGGPWRFSLEGRHAAALLCCHLQCVCAVAGNEEGNHSDRLNR